MSIDKKLQDAQAYGDGLRLQMEQIAIIQQQITDGTIKTTAQMRAAAQEAQKFQKATEDARDAEYAILDITSKLQKPFNQIVNATQKQLDNEIDLAKAMKKKISDAKKAGVMTAGVADEFQRGLDATIAMNTKIKQIAGNKGMANAMAVGSTAADESYNGWCWNCYINCI
jgi:acetyl-CoA acetyltransferase